MIRSSHPQTCKNLILASKILAVPDKIQPYSSDTKYLTWTQDIVQNTTYNSVSHVPD